MTAESGSRRFSVAQVLGVVVGLLVLVAVIGLVVGLLALGRLGDRRDLLTDRLDPANVAVLKLTRALVDQETAVRGFALSGREVFLDPYRRGRATEREALAVLERFQATTPLPGRGVDLRAVVQRIAEWRALYAKPAIEAVRGGLEPPGPATGKARFDSLRRALSGEQDRIQAAHRRARQELKDTALFVRAMFMLAGVMVLVSLLAAAYALRRIVLQPLARLARDVRVVAGGEFAHPLSADGPREVAGLSADVEAMRARIVAEVSALREAEAALSAQAQELQRSNQELEQFAYVASHDLQEPLRKVASFTQMLERRYAGQLDERADQYIAFAVDGAKRMQVLINDLLEFSRVGRSGQPLEPVDCGALVAQAEDRLAAAIEESGAEISNGSLPTVLGDAGLLTTLFQNLIANAIKFRRDGPPHVEIEATPAGERWAFAVTDDGIGIEDEYAERIFVIFQRLHGRTTYDGTGIGLAMCKKIVEYHGGEIALAPAAPGRGARFEFTLPAVPDPEEDQEP